MNPYFESFASWLNKVFDSKTVIAILLIGSATWLAGQRILSSDAWSLMVTTIGGFWGVASAMSSPIAKEIAKALRE